LLVDRHREWFNWRYVALQIVLGSSSAVVFLTSWRIVPTIATIHLVVLSKQLAESSRRFRSLLHSTVLAVAGFALVWVPTFLWELHGDRHAYYKRFFGFYSRASGWGAFAGPEFRLFPGEIMQFGQGPLLLLAALLVAALFRLRRERAQFIAWSLLLPIGWGAYAYGYFRNQGGGGVYYFCPFFFSAWLLILHALRRQSVSRPWVQLASAGLIAYLLPWRGLLDQRQQLADIRSQAQTFLKDVAKRTGGRPVFGEDTHLFKREYRDEIVDTGDTVNAIASSGYYGTDFTRKYQSYAMTLVAAPPQFIIEDMLDLQNRHGTTTPQLADLLRNRYAVAIQGPANLVANVAVRSRGNSPAGTIALFERIAE